MSTIFALASAPGKAGVSVIRVSGPHAFSVFPAFNCKPVSGRTPVLRTLKNGQGEVIDEALILAFESPRSFTGEDVVELHTHGSIAVVKAVFEALTRVDHFRMAEPGEFTRRALENGK